MREALDVLVYEPGSDSWEGEGLVGPLCPTECTYTGEMGGSMNIQMQHPFDPIGKWKALQVGNILKCWIQMQIPPVIDNNAVVSEVEIWKISTTATIDARGIWEWIWNRRRRRYDWTRIGTFAGGEEVVYIMTNPEQTMRYVQYANICGWVLVDSLTFETSRNVGTGTDHLDQIWGGVKLFPQMFEITMTEVSEEGVQVTAQHISYRLMKNLSSYVNPGLPVSLPTVLQAVYDNCLDPLTGTIFEFKTNINSNRFGFEYELENPIKILLDPEEGVAAKWGAEILRDNGRIYLLDQVGRDRGVRIEYGRNLAGINVTYDYTNVATYILPTGDDGAGNLMYLPEKFIVSTHAEDYDQKHIYHLACDGCKLGEDGLDYQTALTRMRTQANALLASGCDLPSVTLKIEVAQCDTDESMAIVELLEPLSLYDYVHIVDDRRGIDIKKQISKVEWDCIHGRVKSIEISDGADATKISLPSWSISSVNGGKIQGGTLTGNALADNVINARHVQSATISAEKISASAITTDKLAAGAVTTDKIAANAITAGTINAGSVTSAVMQTDEFTSNINTLVQASIGTANIGFAQIKDASVQSLFAKDANADKYYAQKLAATSAQIEALMVGQLVFRASDGNYYTLDASVVDGSVTFSPTRYTGTIDTESGITSDGTRYVFGETVDVEDLYASDIHAADALITRIHADQLFANEAFIGKLTTSEIISGQSLNMMAANIATAKSTAERAEAAVARKVSTYYSDTAPESEELVDGDLWVKAYDDGKIDLYRYSGAAWVYLDGKGLGDVSDSLESLKRTLGKYFTFDSALGLIIKGLNPDGTDSPYYTVTGNDGYEVRSRTRADALGSFGLSGLNTIGLDMGKMRCRPTNKGWAFVVREE